MKYKYKLCDKCMAMVTKLNRLEARRRKKLGLANGRPRKPIDDRVIRQLQIGELTIAQAAIKLGVSGVTVRRRLRELEARKPPLPPLTYKVRGKAS